MPFPSQSGFYPSSPYAYPGLANRDVSDTAAGTDHVGVAVTWHVTDSGTGVEQVSTGSASNTALSDFGAWADQVEVSRSRPTLFPPPGPRIPQVPLPSTRLLLADTRSGRIHFELPFTKMTWSQKINQAGSATATIPLEDVLDALSEQGADNPARVIWGFVTGPGRYSLLVAYGKTVLWGGTLNPVDEIPGDPSLDVGATEITSMFSGRVLVDLQGTGSWTDPSRDVGFYSTNPAGLMYQLVEFAVGKGPGYELPIVCSQPPDLPGITNYHYLSYDEVTVLKALQDQAAGDAGPDFRLDPYLYDGADAEYVAYDLRIGNPYLDFGTLWTFDDSTSQVSLSGDSVGMASTLFATGSGQDRDKIVGVATSNDYIDLGFPAVESVDSSRNSETDAAVLASYAQSALAASRSPTLTWSVKALRDGTPAAGQYRIGDLAAVDVREHRLIDHGLHRSRIVALAGDESPWITSTLSLDEDDTTTTGGG